MLLERAKFIHKFVRSPRSIGSITPSSRFLANAMLNPIPWEQTKTVVELGAGTGVFTRELSRRLSPSTQTLIFEQDDELRLDLQKQLPEFIYHKKAEELKQVLNSNQIQEVDVIISGLPFANFPQSLTYQILDQVQESLGPSATFITYQYSLQLRKELNRRFKQVQIRFVPLNFPPTFVYLCMN